MYYDKPVTVHAYAKRIEIFLRNGERIAVHPRRFTGRRYVTITEHMPPNHQAVVSMRSFDGRYYRQKAAGIGQYTYRFVCALLEGVDFEEQAYKSCMAVINFSRQYGNARVEQACHKAFLLNAPTYTTLKNILKNGQDMVPASGSSDADIPTPYHENLRVAQIELRNIIMIYGEETVKGWFMDYNLGDYLTEDQIATIETAGLWTKEKLADKIINHFYMREIGLETPALFKAKLKVMLDEIMEEYLPVIYSTAIEYDPLVNVDFTESYSGSDINSGDSLTVQSDTPQGQISKQAILAGTYASSTGASEASNTNTQSYTKRVKGNSGVSATAQKMILQYRENIRTTTKDIINKLEPLFMGIY